MFRDSSAFTTTYINEETHRIKLHNLLCFLEFVSFKESLPLKLGNENDLQTAFIVKIFYCFTMSVSKVHYRNVIGRSIEKISNESFF